MIEFDAFVEMPAGAEPVKYEVVKKKFRVKRIMDTAYRYPTNYGFIPKTLAEDGDELDVLIITPVPLLPCSLIKCRAIGVLHVEDQKGRDDKIVAVPTQEVCIDYNDVLSYSDLPTMQQRIIQDFFVHYKDNDPDRWSSVDGWGSSSKAEELIWQAKDLYKNSKIDTKQPMKVRGYE